MIRFPEEDPSAPPDGGTVSLRRLLLPRTSCMQAYSDVAGGRIRRGARRTVAESIPPTSRRIYGRTLLRPPREMTVP